MGSEQALGVYSKIYYPYICYHEEMKKSIHVMSRRSNTNINKTLKECKQNVLKAQSLFKSAVNRCQIFVREVYR